MSQAGIISASSGPTPEVETLTGNTGGPIAPIGNNINTVGTGSITIAGNAGTATLTTQLTGLTDHFVLVGAGTATITKVTPSTAGFVLTSNGLAADPSFQTVSASGAVTTLTGDTGGARSPTAGNINVLTGVASNNSGATFAIAGSGSTLTLNVTNSSHSTFIGKTCGNATTTSAFSAGYGDSCLASLTSGGANTAFGAVAGTNITSGNSNVLVGQACAPSLVSGSGNTLIGTSCFNLLSSGSNNVGLGVSSASAYIGGESNNIIIGNNPGILGESNVLRIGFQGVGTGQQNLCYIAGITGVVPTSANVPQVVLCDNAGNLAPISSSTAGFVLTSNGSATPSFQAASASGAITSITGDSGGALSPTAGNLNILGLSGSKTSGTLSTLTIKSPPFSQVGASATSSLNSGEFVTAAVTRTLPASAGLADGDLFIYVCTTAGALVIQSVSAQKIRIGNQITSAAGTATSNAIGDSLTLRFNATDGFFYAVSVVGTWTLSP